MFKRLIFMSLILFSALCITIPVQAANTTTSDNILNTPQVVTDTTTGFINPQTAQKYTELSQLLQDDKQKQNLQQYLDATRPVIEKYQGYFDTATRFGIWTEENVPIIGHTISNLAISLVNHFYQQELKELAQSEIAQKFADFRAVGIDIDVRIFQQALEQYVLNKGVNLQMVSDLQHILNEKAEIHKFMQNILQQSGLHYDPVDEGDILKKMPQL